MKKVKQTLLLIAVASMSAFMSCGPDDGGDKTEKEVLTEALVSTTWTADASVTDVSGVNGTFDIGTFTVKFTETADGLAFTLGGDISSMVPPNVAEALYNRFNGKNKPFNRPVPLRD